MELCEAKYVTSVFDTKGSYLKFKSYYILSVLKNEFKTLFSLLLLEVPHVQKIDWRGIVCTTKPSGHPAVTQ